MTASGGPIAAVVPVYNEGRTAREVVDAVIAHVPTVIVVDDGSTDDSAHWLEGAPVERLRNELNRGKGEALRVGLARARELGAAAVVTLDADGQHPPEYLPAMLACHREDPEAIVIGARSGKHGAAPRYRRVANGVADFFISWAAGRRLTDTQSGFRLYPAAAAAVVAGVRSHRFVYESEALIAAAERGFRVRYVEIPAVYPELRRKSHYRPVLDTTRITLRVAARLLRRGMAPVRLVRVLTSAGNG